MDLKENIEILQSYSQRDILKGGDHNGTPLLKLVHLVYEEYFGQACASCPRNFPGYIDRIHNINLNSVKMSKQKDTREFRMDPTTSIHQRGTSNYWGDTNITDEVAIELLKDNPARISQFVKVPDWFRAGLPKLEENYAKSLEDLKKDNPKLAIQGDDTTRDFLGRLVESFRKLKPGSNAKQKATAEKTTAEDNKPKTPADDAGSNGQD